MKTETLAFDTNVSGLRYQPHWLVPERADQLFEQLLAEVSWRQDTINLFGSAHNLPRLQAWYGDPGTRYSYSGLSMEPLSWLPGLAELRLELQNSLQLPFNSVLVNLYRNGRDSNGWHADNEPELGPHPAIASVSLGATRRFRLRKISDKRQTHAIDLAHGSLLVMESGVQEIWQHQLAKTARPVAERINLTFRNIIHRS